MSTYRVKDKLLLLICINGIEKEERSSNEEEKQLKEGRHRVHKLKREERHVFHVPCMEGMIVRKQLKERKQLEER